MAYATEIYHWNKASSFPCWKKNVRHKYVIFRNAYVQTRQFLTRSSAQAAPALPVLLQSCCSARAAVHLSPEPLHTQRVRRGFHLSKRAGKINPCSQSTDCRTLTSETESVLSMEHSSSEYPLKYPLADLKKKKKRLSFLLALHNAREFLRGWSK